MQLTEDFVNFRITEFPCLIDVYLHAIVILQGYLLLRNASQPTTKATGCEILLYVILYSAMSRIISQKKTGRFCTGIAFQAMNIVFNAIVTHLIALKARKNGFCLLKPNQGFSLDLPGFSIRVCLVVWWHFPRNSVEGKGLKVFELHIMMKIRATGRKFS